MSRFVRFTVDIGAFVLVRYDQLVLIFNELYMCAIYVFNRSGFLLEWFCQKEGFNMEGQRGNKR